MNYILFTSPKHESIKFDFTQEQIKLFRKLWKDGAGHSKICEELKINKNTLALLIIDQSVAGAIDNRPSGIFGDK